MEVWCLLVDHKNRPTGQSFKVEVSSDADVDDLAKMVKAKAPRVLGDIDAYELEVWRFTNSPANFVDNGHEVLEELVSKAFSNMGVKELLPRQEIAGLNISAGEALLVKLPGASTLIPITVQLLSLNCVVLRVDGEPNPFFTVKILKTKNVCRRVDEDSHGSLKDIDLTPLKSLLPLSQVFPHVEGDHLHIVVQAPANGKSISVFLHVTDNLTVVQRAWHSTGFQNVFSHILTALAPADSAKSSNYTKSQIMYSIYDGRYKADKPRTSVAPLVQLFHPAFGHFLDDMEKRDAPLDDIIIPETVEYMKAATAIYKNEKKCREVLGPLLCNIVQVNMQTIQNYDKTTPDGIVELETHGSPFIILLQEDKNEFRDGGSNPSTQAGLSIVHLFFLRLWVTILGAVITDAFNALRASLKKLGPYHEGPDMGNLPDDLHYFPSIAAYPVGSGRANFKYVGFLENGPNCITLCTRIEAMPPQDIVVKFADRYGESAHQTLADHNYAPKLLYCGSPHLHEHEPSYQSIIMIVMEYVDGKAKKYV
ncbi:uncharacterized protein EI90DRAFT_3130658 [Cantharellus anzutake]|uniref:uncharacterized protein n=1 Tax=Cantharellus anzutake TaxID=1750568 RepID=UPI00190884FC|nr:uncharacterized protein EI90DRAFT_3130658 [Cantharellus anzutake]KAF8322894.1 hypothetical protein EI90DRAFT_3130658 [Cantharellus anzutake]